MLKLAIAWACLALAVPAAAQTAPPMGQTAADQAIDGRLRHVADGLRTAAQRLAQDTSTDWQAIRGSVEAAQAALSDLPASPDQEGALARARTSLAEAHTAVEASSPDRVRVAAELQEAAEAVATLRPGLGTTIPRR